MAELDRKQYVASLVAFGGGKSGRESQGQSHAPRSQGTPDLVVTNVIVLDHWGRLNIQRELVPVRDVR